MMRVSCFNHFSSSMLEKKERFVHGAVDSIHNLSFILVVNTRDALCC